MTGDVHLRFTITVPAGGGADVLVDLNAPPAPGAVRAAAGAGVRGSSGAAAAGSSGDAA